MPFAKIRDADIYYEVAGSGPPLLFITGMGGIAAYWRPQVNEFQKDFTVIVFDQRGTGQSTMSKVDYTVAMLAQDVIDLLDCLGLQRVHICGHSTGGMIAQILALDAPERVASMVLYGTRGRADAFTWKVMGMRRQLLLAGMAELYVRSTALFLFPSPWIVEHADRLKQQEDVQIANFSHPDIMASRIEAVLHHHQIERLPAVKVPTLVTCAMDDFLTPTYYSQELHRLIPDSSLEFVTTGGHGCSLANPGAFHEVIRPFFNRMAESA